MRTPRFKSLAVFPFLTATFLLGWSTDKSSGDDLQGAHSLLQKLDAIKPSPAITAPASDTLSQVLKDAKTFSQEASELTPEEAARQWLALYDRYNAVKLKGFNSYQSNGQATKFFNYLPGPECWPALEKLVETRKPASRDDKLSLCLLLLAVHTLNNEEDKQWADLAAISALSADPSASQGYRGVNPLDYVIVLNARLSDVSNDPAQVEKSWNQTFDLMEKAQGTGNLPIQTSMGLQLPDWVALLGAAKAEPLLKRALLLPNSQISSVAGIETKRLAQKVALANIDKITQAPWTLTESLEGGALYEALIKKFPNDSNSQTGATYYVVSLVVQGKPDQASTAAATVDKFNLSEAVEKAVDAGWGSQVYNFLHVYLASHTESTLWSSYIDVAAQTNNSAEALQFVQQIAARPDLSSAAREQVQSVLYGALLAVDKVDEGVAQLRALIKSKANAAPPAVATGTTIIYSYNSDDESLTREIQLARLGHLLQRKDWESEGLDAARDLIHKEADNLSYNNFSSYLSDINTLTTFLMETGENGEAEKLLIDAIVTAAKEKASLATTQNGQDAEASFTIQTGSLMIKLALVYYNAGRWADIITLMENAPGWQAQDLVEIADTKAEYDENYPTPSIGLMAARALSETGHADQARVILDYVLRVNAGSDAAYALFLKIGEGDLAGKLDALYRQDQFQERPLIWKGFLLLKQGRVAEAEKACQAAIAVDPSDGEEGKGDRMRVYSVMADVCEAKHDPQQAAFFRNVVKAIRLSENADDYYEVGLLTRAVNMYDQALNLFSDAYCIQSRLARQLADLGRMQEAAVHYRRAFELMPVSFGRMESHCFGCERAFKGPTAVEIAEKTFNDMIARDPKKPQLYYLLGYLYMEQERYVESAANFQKAAELDPDYINAWKNIVEIGQNCHLAPDLQDAAVFNVIRLDPGGRHISPSLDKVRQLAKLWQAEETAAKAITPQPISLYPLKASALADEKQVDKFEKLLPPGIDADEKAQLLEELHSQMRTQSINGMGTTPVAAILGNGVISTCLQGQ